MSQYFLNKRYFSTTMSILSEVEGRVFGRS